MKAAFVLAGVLLVAVTAWVGLGPRAASDMRIEEVTANPMMSGDIGIFLNIDNQGAPDRLVSVRSDEADIFLYTPAPTDTLPIQVGRSSLALDAAHIRVAPGSSTLDAGVLLPLTLTFENAGEVHVKARMTDDPHSGHMGMAGMGDKAQMEIDMPTPSLAIAASPEGDGWRVKLTTEDFTFSQEQMDAPHQPGVGHGHIYVGGMKVGRVFGDDTILGQLPPGTHEISVTLNTNDHRPYRGPDGPVSAATLITVD